MYSNDEAIVEIGRQLMILAAENCDSLVAKVLAEFYEVGDDDYPSDRAKSMHDHQIALFLDHIKFYLIFRKFRYWHQFKLESDNLVN